MNHFTKIAKIILMGVLALGITFGPQSAWTVQAAEASTQQTGTNLSGLCKSYR